MLSSVEHEKSFITSGPGYLPDISGVSFHGADLLISSIIPGTHV